MKNHKMLVITLISVFSLISSARSMEPREARTREFFDNLSRIADDKVEHTTGTLNDVTLVGLAMAVQSVGCLYLDTNNAPVSQALAQAIKTKTLSLNDRLIQLLKRRLGILLQTEEELRISTMTETLRRATTITGFIEMGERLPWYLDEGIVGNILERINEVLDEARHFQLQLLDRVNELRRTTPAPSAGRSNT